MRQQLHHRPSAGRRGRDGLDPGVVIGHPGLILADEVPQLLVAADLAGAGVVNHHLARPRGLEDVAVAPVQRGEELPDRISVARGAGLLARQLYGAGEIRKPRHDTPHSSLTGASAGCGPLSSGDPGIRSAGSANASRALVIWPLPRAFP